VDGLFHPDHMQFALRGCLAASSAYIIYKAVAIADCIAGCDAEKMQRLPDLGGLKNEVIMPTSPVMYTIKPPARWE
jgi:hypothetical protein